MVDGLPQKNYRGNPRFSYQQSLPLPDFYLNPQYPE